MTQRIRADFGERVAVQTRALPWAASPLPGVERRMLDRVGDEVARATSIVRYAPGSRFSPHVHARGEELLVLEGVFSDESGDFPAGSYVRNPPGSRHAPRSADGCTLFVKLRQFADDDTAQVVVDTRSAPFARGSLPGVEALELHRHGTEHVRLLRLAPGARIPARPLPGGEEILVLEGGYRDELARHTAGTWVRNPPGSAHGIASDQGALLWIKTGHLTAV